ncbi:conserved hypothetical protein [Candidatus Brocadia pituitae]|nr:conserved hypothetical protein [Candidatus Brocadia pituitae]
MEGTPCVQNPKSGSTFKSTEFKGSGSNGGEFRCFLGRKGDGEPGTKTLWLGIQRLDDMTAMWKVFVTELTPHSLSPP